MAGLTDWTIEVAGESRARGSDRLVMLVISMFADREGRAYPGTMQIAAYAALGPAQVHAILTRLVEQGELAVLERGHRGRATVYQLTPGGHTEPATPPNPVTPRPLPAVTEPDDQPLDDGPQPAARPAWEPTWPRIITRAMYLDPEHPWRADCPPNLLDWLDREGPPDHDDWVWALMSPRAVPLLNHASQPYLGSKSGPR